MSKIVIIGAGAMGSAFALPCIDNKHDVCIIGTHLENDFIDNLNANGKLHSGLNIKLDKAGGLTEALRLKKNAKAKGFKIMVGCMISTSLAMAPAYVVAYGAEYVDIDGPLLLAEDRIHGLEFSGSSVSPPSKFLWG